MSAPTTLKSVPTGTTQQDGARAEFALAALEEVRNIAFRANLMSREFSGGSDLTGYDLLHQSFRDMFRHIGWISELALGPGKSDLMTRPEEWLLSPAAFEQLQRAWPQPEEGEV